jgi:hypothetical protein
MEDQRASLRVQSLKKRLAGHPNAERLYEYASLLDGWIHEWARYASKPGLREDERMRAVNMLASMRRDFNALLAEVDAHDHGGGVSPTKHGTALDALGPDERFALAQILGLQYEPRYRELFEVKAAEYLEQDALWNAITEEDGLVETAWMPADSGQSAVILTYSGSLLLVSAPTEAKQFRRQYVYQSIYAGHVPTEGSLGLLEPVRVNQPVVGTRIKTSPVRKLRISSGPEGWEQRRATFQRLHRTLNGVITPHTGGSFAGPPPAESSPQAAPPAGATKVSATPLPGASLFEGLPSRATPPDGTPMAPRVQASPARPSEPTSAPAAAPAKEASRKDTGIPSVFVQVLHAERQRESVRKLESTARAELRTLLARLIDSGGDGDHVLEAEILGHVLYLQRLAMERGELNAGPSEVLRLDTENNDQCVATADGLSVGKRGGAAQNVPGASFRNQVVVRGAPVAVMLGDGSLFAVLGNVRAFVKKP